MKILVKYEHDSADLSTKYLAVTPLRVEPSEEDWQAAVRDMVDGVKLLFIRVSSIDERRSVVWLKDRFGVRTVKFTVKD